MLKFCLPLLESSKRSVFARLQDIDPAYSFYEIWLDYIADIDVKFIENISTEYPSKLIFVFRRQNLEPMHMPHEKRQALLSALDDKGAYLDLDIRTQLDELQYVKERRLNVPLISSYHNYNLTPPVSELTSIVTEMEPFSPAIYKFSTLCRDRNDALNLLSLLLRLDNEGKKHIVLGMGEHGKILRVFGALWGNEINFAPETLDKSSAPGQLSLRQLQSILRELK
ncbi:MAG: type I 3-dehydroquinate dehydratase [Deltaproteobacteria bacterium]|nr:type I 3-dehydroquinate dehydratase [Deltaproteobacteria bacterium]